MESKILVPAGTTLPPLPVPIYHTHHKCRRIAFYTRRRWEPGERMTAGNVIPLEGMLAPQAGDPIVCGTCKKPVDPKDLNYTLPATVQRAREPKPKWPGYFKGGRGRTTKTRIAAMLESARQEGRRAKA